MEPSAKQIVCTRHPVLGCLWIMLRVIGRSLQLPTDVPKGITQSIGAVHWCPAATERSSIVRGGTEGQTVWACESELFEATGQQADATGAVTIKGIHSVFGMKIDDHSLKQVRAQAELLSALKEFHKLEPDPPIAMYHGTSVEAASSILKTGLRGSFGMLGFGCYMTTFWKAAGRYGRRSGATYELRECGGAVVRVYVPLDASQIDTRGTSDSRECECPKCFESSKVPAAAKRTCDHLSAWKTSGLLAAKAGPSVHDRATGKQVVSDAEMCVFEGCVYPQDIALVDAASASDLKGGAYNNADRTISIA